MGKLAFIFPGQGSQYVGMGKDLYDAFPEVREVYEEADSILGFSLSSLCFDGPEEDLKLTINTQPALYVASAAALRVLQSKNIKPDVTAGHSIGEYAALTASNALQFADGLRLVRKRGELMNKASMANPGAMAAVIGLSADIIKTVCEKASDAGIVEVANYNSSAQTVISGEADAVKAAQILLKEAGAKRVIPLSVSGGFHSSLMQSASSELSAELADTPISDPAIPIIANITADFAASADAIKELLAKQISGSVLWNQTMSKMAAYGVDCFVEVGPGQVLTGLLKREVKDEKLYNANSVEGINETINAIAD